MSTRDPHASSELIWIGGRAVGAGHPCLVIAEAGVNHNGNLDMARQLVDVAVDAGADAVKFQAFKAERLVCAAAPKARYQLERTSQTESQLEMLRRLELSIEQLAELFAYCRERAILFLCTPFDETSADALDTLGVAAFKIPSGEVTNLPLLAHVACKDKPMLLSTGMSNLGEVDAAVRTVREAGNDALALLHCVSNYPAAPEEANLRAMHTMRAAFQTPVGYSDHTAGTTVALAAVALGAAIIEKHVTLTRTLPGPDHHASLEPQELAQLVQGIRTVEAALGHGRKEPTASELDTAAIARKSLIAAEDIAAGTRLTERSITIKRPGTGLPPSMLEHVVGSTAAVDIPADTLLTMEMLR
jgi:N-acetylneuraminate synthase